MGLQQQLGSFIRPSFVRVSHILFLHVKFKQFCAGGSLVPKSDNLAGCTRTLRVPWLIGLFLRPGSAAQGCKELDVSWTRCVCDDTHLNSGLNSRFMWSRKVWHAHVPRCVYLPAHAEVGLPGVQPASEDGFFAGPEHVRQPRSLPRLTHILPPFVH